ncbi:MAG: AAA family ATPase [Bacteroidetes bacterium]|nr:AAA family ATPase [Bacteroidota bacterium]
MIGIKGGRGTGKTTLLLQYAKIISPEIRKIYISLDDIYFSEIKLPELADEFVKTGGTLMLIDEVHRHRNWSQELKNIYDRYPELKVIFTGSSMLHLTEKTADLSRRAVIYNLPGFSLREYINITSQTSFQPFLLQEILSDHLKISKLIREQVKPIQKLHEYLEYGYYPFFLESLESFPLKLRETINVVLEAEIPYLTGIERTNIDKLKQLLYIISVSVPFKPNIQRLSERTGMGKNTLKAYLHYLNEACIIHLLYSEKEGISLLTKPEKIYLHHPNLQHCIASSHADLGNIRESFFLNQVSQNHTVSYPEAGDFLVDGNFLFEIGGKNKGSDQIRNINNSWLALDDIETGLNNSIPLWLFGFLY